MSRGDPHWEDASEYHTGGRQGPRKKRKGPREKHGWQSNQCGGPEAGANWSWPTANKPPVFLEPSEGGDSKKMIQWGNWMGSRSHRSCIVLIPLCACCKKRWITVRHPVWSRRLRAAEAEKAEWLKCNRLNQVLPPKWRLESLSRREGWLCPADTRLQLVPSTLWGFIG